MTDVDAEGKPIFGPSAGADAFKAAMEKYVSQGILHQTIYAYIYTHTTELYNYYLKLFWADKKKILYQTPTLILILRNPLKFTAEGDDDIKLFAEDDEPVNILNIKRGLISALAVPVLEEDRNRRMVSH